MVHSLHAHSYSLQEIPFALVSERVSFPFLRMQTRRSCVLDQEQALRPCVLSLNNVHMPDTAVRIAVLVHQLILMTLDTILYFGCRSAHKDQHYRSEWEAYAREQKLRYRIACSRDGLEGSKRTYVQDLMHNDAQDIWKMLGQQRGILIISGWVSTVCGA